MASNTKKFILSLALLLLFNSNCFSFTLYINTIDEYKDEIERLLKQRIFPEPEKFCPHPNTYDFRRNVFSPYTIEEDRLEEVLGYFMMNYKKWMSRSNEPELFCHIALSDIRNFMYLNNIKFPQKKFKFF